MAGRARPITWWEKHLMTYKTCPPLQPPETYNLEGILKQMQKSNHPGD
jgi:hypothetical protein